MKIFNLFAVRSQIGVDINVFRSVKSHHPSGVDHRSCASETSICPTKCAGAGKETVIGLRFESIFSFQIRYLLGPEQQILNSRKTIHTHMILIREQLPKTFFVSVLSIIK